MALDLGDVYRLNFTNLSPAGAPVSANTMTVTVTLPDLTIAGPFTVSPDTTGVYHYDYQTVQPGPHSARWLGTGTNPGAHVESFDVRSANPRYIVSLADTKQQLNMTSTADDEELRTYLEATTDLVEDHLGRAVIRRSFTEEHSACGEIMLNWTPVASLTSVATVDGVTTWNVADLHVSTSGIVTAKAGATALLGEVAVVYVAGDLTVPSKWTLAARIILQDLWQTQRGSAGGPQPGGMDLPGAGFTSLGYDIPPAAKKLLSGRLTGV